jgi:hypothetical protein
LSGGDCQQTLQLIRSVKQRTSAIGYGRAGSARILHTGAERSSDLESNTFQSKMLLCKLDDIKRDYYTACFLWHEWTERALPLYWDQNTALPIYAVVPIAKQLLKLKSCLDLPVGPLFATLEERRDLGQSLLHGQTRWRSPCSPTVVLLFERQLVPTEERRGAVPRPSPPPRLRATSVCSCRSHLHWTAVNPTLHSEKLLVGHLNAQRAPHTLSLTHMSIGRWVGCVRAEGGEAICEAVRLRSVTPAHTASVRVIGAESIVLGPDR